MKSTLLPLLAAFALLANACERHPAAETLDAIKADEEGNGIAYSHTETRPPTGELKPTVTEKEQQGKPDAANPVTTVGEPNSTEAAKAAPRFFDTK